MYLILQVLRKLIVLVITFTICTGFQHALYLITTFTSELMSRNTLIWLYATSNLVVSLQAAINPFIYGNLLKKSLCCVPIREISKLRCNCLSRLHPLRTRFLAKKSLCNSDVVESSDTLTEKEIYQTIRNDRKRLSLPLSLKLDCEDSLTCSTPVEDLIESTC